jgi:hypothetical protein
VRFGVPGVRHAHGRLMDGVWKLCVGPIALVVDMSAFGVLPVAVRLV